jgi:hypothetical protein
MEYRQFSKIADTGFRCPDIFKPHPVDTIPLQWVNTDVSIA